MFRRIRVYTKYPWSTKFIPRNVKYDKTAEIMRLENFALYSITIKNVAGVGCLVSPSRQQGTLLQERERAVARR